MLKILQDLVVQLLGLTSRGKGAAYRSTISRSNAQSCSFETKWLAISCAMLTFYGDQEHSKEQCLKLTYPLLDFV